MVQEEVARRMVATEKSPAKEYGLLTILSQFWAECSIIRLVGRKSFYPAPKVDSALVKITLNDKPRVDVSDYSFLKRVVKACFATRRKNLKNSLLNAGFAKDAVSKTLSDMNISENTRGETLSIDQLANLSEELKRNL